MRYAVVVFVALLALAAAAARPVVRLVDGTLNSTRAAPPAPASDAALALHRTLWIADLHCDAMLWDRDFLRRSDRGQADLPRLLEGGVDLQVFSAVTRHYAASNYRRTPPVLDVQPLLAIASRWPRGAWFDPYRRARFEAARLHEFARASAGRLRMVESAADLDALLESQARGDSVVGAVLLLEGLHAVDGRLALVDSLFAAGFRVFGITHLFDNELGGSSTGWRKGGLTPFGRRALARLDSLGAIVDLAHASPAVIEDVLAALTGPVMISHTGAATTCPSPRNVSDDVLARVGARGGLVGVGFWDRAVCGRDARAIARTVRHVADVAGVGHVALGSDFDGAVRTPFDAAGLALLTEALLAEGFSRDETALVMGENVKRFLRTALPEKTTAGAR